MKRKLKTAYVYSVDRLLYSYIVHNIRSDVSKELPTPLFMVTSFSSVEL